MAYTSFSGTQAYKIIPTFTFAKHALTTIISDNERRRRHREKERGRKHDAGEVEMSRQEYLTRAAKRRAEARRMAAEGLSDGQIAARLGISRRRVNQLLKEPLSDA